MCYMKLIRDAETFKRYPPDGILISEQSDHYVVFALGIDAWDPFASHDCFHGFSPVYQVFLRKPQGLDTMNAGHDEISSGLNGRLRPRKSTASNSPKIKDPRKPDGKYFLEKSKKNIFLSKTSPKKPNDLTDKSDSSPVLNFLCPYCNKKFVSQQAVSKHANRIHLSISKQQSLIECLFCNHNESEPNNIIRHMVDSHPNQYFACFDCHTRFPSTSELAEHKLNVCEQQKVSYRSKLRQKSSGANEISKKLNVNCKSSFPSNYKGYSSEPDYNGIVISCELKPSQVHDAADIEDNLTTNLILPPTKNIGNKSLLKKNAVIVLDDIQWNKRLPPNFTFHNTEADEIISRLGVIHRTPRTGETTRRDWFKNVEESTQKFEKCFDTSFYKKVASNIHENLTKFLDGSFNFNPEAENAIKTRKTKNSVVINTVEGFPILLNCTQYSRTIFDGCLPRTIAPKHKCKWDNLENDKTLINPDQIKRDSHTDNCIITLVSSLDIWTQICMRRKYEDKFCNSPVEKKVEKRNSLDKELKDILESRELPVSSSQVIEYTATPTLSEVPLEFPASLGLTPSLPKYQIQPAILSGEWVRPRCYVCCACGAQTRDARALTSHISTQHTNAQVEHYEIVGESLLNADILNHLYVPPNQSTNRTRPLRGFRECTKCKVPVSLEDLHQHMLDCAGDTPTVRRKCRYRPFGVRRRRPRLPDNTIRKKIRKDIRNGQNQKSYMRSRARPRNKTEVGDAETIRKMLADLPAKRHRVLINPVNSMLRPRRKFDVQRSKLLIKPRPSDDPRNSQLRGKNNSYSRSPGEPTQKKITSKDNGDKHMRATMKHANKTGGHNESFKRSSVFKMTRKSVKKTIPNDEETDPTESANDEPPDDLPVESSDSPQKIDVNGGPYKTRERSGGHEGTSSGSGGNGFNSRSSESDDPGGGGGNPDGSGDNPEGGRSNNNSDRPNDGRQNDDKNPVQNTPLKHSIARLTANSETHDKSVQFHHLFLVQQECNNIPEHAPTEQRELFENEAVVTKLDKPPLHYPKGALDTYSLQKNKLNKPRKGLNDCIAMLKRKLNNSPSRHNTSQVSVQCGDDEPIQPMKYAPRTVFESGINMTPAKIFYRPLLPEGPVLSTHCNLQNFATYSYITPQSNITTRSEKPKGRPKKIGQICDKSYPKEKQVEYLPKRKSTRVKSTTRADIEMQLRRICLPPQIEIIPHQPENVHNIKSTKLSSRDIYKNIEPTLLFNQQILNNFANYKRRTSVDMKFLQNTQKKSSYQVQPESHITFDTKYQTNNWSKGQIVARKSPKYDKNQETNQIQVPVTKSQNPAEDVSKYNTQIISNDVYSENNYNEVAAGFPSAQANTPTFESNVLTPLDLSGKNLSGNCLENRSQENDIYYDTNYDECGTLDLSNKRLDYSTVNKEGTVMDAVVDLSIKPIEELSTEPSNTTVYGNSRVDDLDSVTDLSTSKCEMVYLPRNLSMRTNEFEHNQVITENVSYEVQDLSGCKVLTETEIRLPYSDMDNIDKDIPTDLSGKMNKDISDNLVFQSCLDVNTIDLIDTLDLSRNIDLPADLSVKSINGQQEIHSPVLETTSNEPLQYTQDTNIKSLSLPITDKSRNESLNTEYNTLKLSEYNIIDNTITIEEQSTLMPEKLDINLNSVTMSCATTVRVCTTHTYVPNCNQSIDVTPQPRSSTLLNFSSQERTPYVYPSNTSRTSIPLYTLPNHSQLNHTGSKYESTKPVYTLANVCIAITKIDTSNATTLTNTLLSVPGTTIANTTSIYTLAGTSVGNSINFGNIPQTVNEIRNIIDNSSIFHSSISSTRDVNKAVEKYNLSAKVRNDVENEQKNSSDTILAYYDPETTSKIAKLPKEIVDILETMPVDHRKQLLNILPHYVTLSTDSSLQLETNQHSKSDETLPNIMTIKNLPYLQVQNADSTSGFKNCDSMKLDGNSSLNNSCKSQNLAHIDIKQIPLPPSPRPPLSCEIDTNKSVNSDHTNFCDNLTKGSNCCDTKIIDLTEDDVHVIIDSIKESDNVNQTSAIITASELKCITVPSKGNKQKINDQTASLRAVRIKTPSERQKIVSTEHQTAFNNQIKPTRENISIDKNKGENKQLTIKTAEVNIKVTGDSHSTMISHVDFESNNKKLKDATNKKTSEYITIKIDVDQDTQSENVVINSGLNPTANKSNDINYIISDKAPMSSNIENTLNMNIDVENASKNNNILETIENLDHTVITPTNKQNITNDNERNTQLISSLNNKKIVSDWDDSEDDILLAVIVKQRRDKQNINKLDIESKYHVHENNKRVKKLVVASTTSNEIKFQTQVPTIIPTIISRKSNKRNRVTLPPVLENNQTVDIHPANTDECFTEKSNNKQKHVKKKTTINKPNNEMEQMVCQIDKVDMGVQYESDIGVVIISKDCHNKNNSSTAKDTQNTNEQSDKNMTPENENYITNVETENLLEIIKNNTTSSKEVCSQNLKLTLQSVSTENKQDSGPILDNSSAVENIEKFGAGTMHENLNITMHPENVTDDSTVIDDKSKYKINKRATRTKQSINIDKEKSNDAVELSVGSDIEERTPMPLRRSRRGKSMFVQSNISISYDDDNATHSEVLLENKTPLTKKQLIFSKLLLDEEKRPTDISVYSKSDNDNIKKDDVLNFDNDLTIQNSIENSVSEINIDNPKKRTKSSEYKRKIKKKKLHGIKDVCDIDDREQLNKISKPEKNIENDVLIRENIVTNVNIDNVKSTDKIDSTRIIEGFSSKSQFVEEKNNTVTDCAAKISLGTIFCDAKSKNISTEKQKLVLPTTSSDLALHSNPKKMKAINETVISTFGEYVDPNLKQIVIEQPNRVYPTIEPRTTCYNRLVVSKRTRSKSTAVKSAEKELNYDPYDINLDDMIANAEPVKRKRLKPNKPISCSVRSLNELPGHSNFKNSKKRGPPPVLRRKVKKSLKQRDRLRQEKRVNDNESDSDDSSKSDVPLTKYIRDREKRAKKSNKDLLNRNDYDKDLSDDTSNDKQSGPDGKSNRRTLTNFNNADTSSSHDETEERLKSEQFMESFGFFSERKPRKSNLLAAKKISETFHLIANESDDTCVGYREREIKRALQNENKKTREDESQKAKEISGTRKSNRRVGRRKKAFSQLLRCVCNICKKRFRRPDSYLRHQFTTLHISKLAEILNIKIQPFLDEPNYLIVYKQHLDRLKIITDKLAKKKKNAKCLSIITLPTLTDILVEVNRVIGDQVISRRGLSRDEELFLDCCELLKESRINDSDPHDSNYRCPQATMAGLALIEKQIDDDVSDDEVDSITAKNILESEEVRNLENDLISGLKEAANAINAHKTNSISYQNIDDNAVMNCNETTNEVLLDSSQLAEKIDTNKEPSTNKVKKPEVKKMMYPDIIEDIDMYEDKFDKIKRKCRSQAAAAKQMQNIIKTNASQKTRKRSDRKKVKKNLKKKHQSTHVPTKGALKGFDSIKVSNSQPEPKSVGSSSRSRSKKKRKKSSSKKKRDKKVSESSNNQEIRKEEENKKVDVYEFMDNDDAELFEFRPSTLMERFKSINNKPVPSTSKVSPPENDADNSDESVSDEDDFVYMSDDYVGSDDETENSMSCEVGNNKLLNERKKDISPLKRRDIVEKNAVMGKIFKHNAVRTEKKCTTYKETSKPKANMDQLFDSLLEDAHCSSANNSKPKQSAHCSRYVPESMIGLDESSFHSPNVILFPNQPPNEFNLNYPKRYESPINNRDTYIGYDTPSTSKKFDEFLKYNTEPTNEYKEFTLKKDLNTAHTNNHVIMKTTVPLVDYSESSQKSDESSIKTYNSTDNSKIKSPSKNPDEGIGTNFDYSNELYDETGVARQRARRKCTVGKQKVLAETWSSESEPDGVHPRPNSAESDKSDNGRKKKGRKREGHQTSGRRGSNRSVMYKKRDKSRLTSSHRNPASDVGRSQGGESSCGNSSKTKWMNMNRGGGQNKRSFRVTPSSSNTLTTSRVRPRFSSNHCLPDGDEEQDHLKQHGWIVGNSHKKIVTMLAHAKGRKRNDDKRHMVE